MEKQIIKVGIIGCGSIARERHIPEGAKNPNVKLAGFYDHTPERAAEFARQYDATAYSTVEEMLNDPEIDAVIVCTPNFLHAEMTIKALQSGKDVFCEKPMATSLEECQQMVAVAKQTGHRLLIDQNQRLAPAHQKARQLLADGAIGKPLTFKASFGHGGPETWSVNKGNGTWFFNAKASKYGAVFDLGIHKIDVLRYLFAADFASVYGKLVTLDKKGPDGQPIAVDDNAFGILKTTDGVIGSLAASWTYYGEEDNATIIYGSRGIMKIYDDPKYSIILKLKNGETVKYEVGQIQTNDNQTDSGVVAEFAQALIDDRPSVLDAEAVINSMQTVFTLIKASEEDHPCQVK